ncbi:MAG TPA: amidohydrolase family protein, partial [Candidatus Methanomethylicus sp.]|nr:amidohydrolase family protein [Candidatus Methanomethylicus sp.]
MLRKLPNYQKYYIDINDKWQSFAQAGVGNGIKKIFFLLVVSIFVCIGVLFLSGQEQMETAGNMTLFINGTIYLDPYHTASNLLVENGTIIALNVDSRLYPNAKIVDLAGAYAYPGFSDSHVHLMETGYVLQTGVNLIGCNNSDQIAERLAEKAKTVPEGELILGVGFSLRNYDNWTLEDLAKIDNATGNRPTFLGDKLGHNAIVNSATIRLANLTPETSVPLGGTMGIENGQLTGMMRESALIMPWNKIFEMFKYNDIKSGTSSMLNLWASMGYTSIVDLMGGPGARFMCPEVFYELEKEGNLPVRVNYCYTIFSLSDVDEAAKYMGNDTDMVRFVGAKIFVDGAYAGGQAWTSWINEQGGQGLQEIYTNDSGGPELNLNRIVARAEEYGMNVHYHTQGDKAIDAVLDALDQVREEKGEINGTHTLIHLAFLSDSQIERIKSFNGHVVTTTQPGFWNVQSDSAYYYGERAAQAYPVKKMIDSGISVGISTDFSVSPLEYSYPTAIIGIAERGGASGEHSPLSAQEIVSGLTIGSARTTGKDD